VSQNITTNKFSFIDFLKKEFGVKPAVFSVEIDKSVQLQPVKSQRNRKFNWFVPQQPRSLANVLDIKLNEENIDAKKNEIDADFEDESVDLWHKNFDTNKKYLLSQKSRKKSGRNNFLIEFFNQSYFNIPGIFSYCREEENASESPSWLNKSIALVFAVFILAIFSSAYLVGNGKIENKNVTTNVSQKKVVVTPSKAMLANYVKINNEWLQEQFSDQSVIIVKAEDILGRVAGATEVIDDNVINNKEELSPEELLLNKYNAFLNKLYNYFKNLEDEQKEASFFLSNSVANIVAR